MLYKTINMTFSQYLLHRSKSLFQGHFYLVLIMLLSLQISAKNTNVNLNQLASIEQDFESGILHLNGAEGYHKNSKNDIKLFYKLKPGTSLGTWNKTINFASLHKFTDLLEINILSTEQKLIAPVIEIKGTNGTQSAPLSFTQNQILIDWNLIGQLNEVVVLIHRTGGEEIAQGEISFELEFKSLNPDPLISNKSPYNLHQAAESGPLSMEGALCFSKITPTGTKITYTLPPGGIAGLWSKSYPVKVNAETTDLIEFDVSLSDRQHALALTVEVKGNKGAQIITLTEDKLKALLDWTAIGQLQEVVLLINHGGGDEVLVGALNFDLSFQKLPKIEKITSSLKGRFQALITLALLTALVFFFLAKTNKNPASGSPLLLAPALSLIAMGALLIYGLSDTARLDQYKMIIALPFISLLAGLLLKLSTNKQMLSSREAFSNVFFPGLLAITTSANPIWLQPSTWSEL